MRDDPSDEILMQDYGNGDLAAFKELYRRHSRNLFTFIAWRSPRKDWVDEIVQDSWANLHNTRARYQPHATFRTYLFQIARNRLIDLVRQQQFVLVGDMAGDASIDDVIDRMGNHTGDTLSPEGALAHKQDNQALHAAIRMLPSEQREALVLQQFNGMSLDEIATLTATSTETVKSRLRYAMRKLRQQLEPAGEQEESA